MNFEQLIQNISDTHDIFQIRAFQSIKYKPKIEKLMLLNVYR